jgi:hypothetical protein
MQFSPEDGRIEKPMVPPESARQKLSNEWSCQCFNNLKFLGQFLFPTLSEGSHPKEDDTEDIIYQMQCNTVARSCWGCFESNRI